MYLIRFHDPGVVTNDIIIDYSIPNIVNVAQCLPDVAAKMVYVPIFFPFEKDKVRDVKRELDILTTFFIETIPRRARCMELLRSLGYKYTNRNNIYDANDLPYLYHTAKIMVNIRQTDFDHTLEEIRIVPALDCGILVICEECPLKEHVPFAKYIIWTTYDNIANTVHDVLSNYDEYYQKIHGPDSELPQLLRCMKTKSVYDLQNMIHKVLHTKQNTSSD